MTTPTLQQAPPRSPSVKQIEENTGPPLQPTESNTSDVPEIPPPPIPSSDPSLNIDINQRAHPNTQYSSSGLFGLTPLTALKLLGAGVETLVRITGDIPPTPPPRSPTIPNMRGMQAEKENIVRSHSEKNLARLRQQADAAAAKLSRESSASSGETTAASAPVSQLIDGVRLRSRTPTPTQPTFPSTPPSSSSSQPEPYIIIGADSQPLNLQHSAITRKFYSKKPPPISIEDYLARIHRFCPMSTAVYLATSLYIHRLAVDERAIPVTRRNCHRLLLAGLRVAMKALEDLSYPHSKIAKVGGVSEPELARLEISFCFLAGFELVVGEDVLLNHWETLKEGRSARVLTNTPILRLELRKGPKDRERENDRTGG
jgi:hypothetical protein